MRVILTALLLVAMGVSGQIGPAAQSSLPKPLSVTTSAGDHVVLELDVDDRAARDLAAVGALLVKVDGQEGQSILMTPGTGRTSYNALLGPLSAGPHQVTFERSTLWPWPEGLGVARTSARVVPAGSADSLVLAHTPTLGIRADTIGTASDIPLMLYVEDERRAGRGWVRYSVIISHEDGGTPAPALMARWGRTTDIELIYEVELDGTRFVQDRFQGPDHEVRAFAGPREGQHPVLLVATLNNMFIDRGRSLANVRMVPRAVNLERRTRESVMDDNPWIYPLMARELVAEKRIGTQIEDPRSFLYVEAGLTLEHAAASVQVGSDEAGWKDSTRGRADLAVNRNGWVRIAVHAPTPAATLKWECRALPPHQPAQCLGAKSSGAAPSAWGRTTCRARTSSRPAAFSSAPASARR